MHTRRLTGPSTRTGTPLSSEAAYSLVEVLIVVGLIATASAAAIVMPGFSRLARADGEMQRLVAGLRQGHDLAVAQRRNVAIEFPGANQVRLVRQDVSGGAVTGTTELATIVMESDFAFRQFPGVPDTPDGFGAGSAQWFGGAAAILFTSEGALVDQTGDPINGTLFIGRRDDPPTARAVTILGATGLVTGYRWDGRHWTR